MKLGIRVFVGILARGSVVGVGILVGTGRRESLLAGVRRREGVELRREIGYVFVFGTLEVFVDVGGRGEFIRVIFIEDR